MPAHRSLRISAAAECHGTTCYKRSTGRAYQPLELRAVPSTVRGEFNHKCTRVVASESRPREPTRLASSIINYVTVARKPSCKSYRGISCGGGSESIAVPRSIARSTVRKRGGARSYSRSRTLVFLFFLLPPRAGGGGGGHLNKSETHGARSSAGRSPPSLSMFAGGIAQRAPRGRAWSVTKWD